jgi:hypothetical protein
MDIDFVAWGPLASPSDCGLDSSQIVDCSYSTSTIETATFLNTQSGEYYKVMISNFSDQPGSFDITTQSMGGQVCSTTGCPGPVVQNQQICQVQTNPAVNHNFIIWEKDSTYTGDYLLQKETSTIGVFTTIHTALNSDTSVYEDMISDPTVQAFKYRIATYDTCGNYFYGNPHTTMHLQVTAAMFTGYPQLSWSAYSGFSYATYYIYRGTSPSTLMLYDSIATTSLSYTDVVPVAGSNSYAVAVQPPFQCQPSRVMTGHILSNVFQFISTGIDNNSETSFLISPNPANSTIQLQFPGNTEMRKISILDLSGRLIISENTLESTIILNAEKLSSGFYIIQVDDATMSSKKKVLISK